MTCIQTRQACLGFSFFSFLIGEINMKTSSVYTGNEQSKPDSLEFRAVMNLINDEIFIPDVVNPVTE